MDRNQLELLAWELECRQASNRIWKVKLHEKQQKVIEAFTQFLLVIVLGGNRTGKTEVGAVAVIRWLIEHPGETWWGLSPTFSSQREGMQVKIDFYLPPELIKKIAYQTNGAYSRIELVNKSQLVFHTYDQGRVNLQSAGINGVWFDEEPPEDVYREVTMRQIAGKPLKVIMTMTPLLGQPYIKELLKLGKTISMSWKDNPHLTANQLELMRAGRSERELAVREHGELVEAFGRVISRLPEVQSKKINIEEYDWWEAIDPGFVDPTGYVLVGINSRSEIVVCSSWSEPGLDDEQMAQRILLTRGVKKIYRSLIDNNEPRLRVGLAKHGVISKSISKQPEIGSWDEYLASKANWFFENEKITFLPGAQSVLTELKHLYWKTKSDEQMLPIFDDHRRFGHHFDQAIALLYLLSEINKRYIAEKKQLVNPMTWRRPTQRNSKVIYKNIN